MKKIKYILLTLITFLALNSFGQKSTKLTIKVKDEQNKPVPGAVILFDDVKQKRLANSNGIFKAKLKKEPKIISAFSPSIGIAKVKYDGKNNIVIKITEGNELYVVNTSNNKVDSTIQFRDIYDYMRGKVPGVNVSPNNRITIRGFNSVNGSTTPMFILNNMQVDEAFFADVVPTTIKSIKVLKGPETANYGSRGANGVIEVTTF